MVLQHLHDSKYERLGRIGDPCVYCGDFSDTLDHVPPLSSIPSDLTLLDIDKSDKEYFLLPSCKECNCWLSNIRTDSIEERQNYVASKITKKYKKYFNRPQWSEDELEDMSPKFAKSIRAEEILANIQRERLYTAKRNTK